MPDFKKLITGPAGAIAGGIGAAARALAGGEDEPNERQAMIARLLANDTGDSPIKAPASEFSLPGLDDSLNEAGQKRKAAAEAAGQPFDPTDEDFTDSGPYGYRHKKAIHDALMGLHQEMQANAPDIDYKGILQQRMADIAAAPPDARTNPLYLFAMAMGDPENANELIQQHNKTEAEQNEKQSARWQELLDLKQQALEGSVKQALAQGEQRKIISSKWLDQLAQIEQDKARLSGELKKNAEKNAAAERRAVLRGQWAVRAVQQRTAGILAANGIKSDSQEFRALQASAKTLAERLIKNGTDPVDAFDEAQDWVESQMGTRTTANAGVGGGAKPATPSSATTNPLEARIKANRGTTPTP